jgi:CHAT domain-containing protein
VSEQSLRDDVAQARLELTATDLELASQFPKYRELTRTVTLQISEARALLQANEAMVVYFMDSIDSFVWVIRSSGHAFIPLKVDVAQLSSQIGSALAAMDSDDLIPSERLNLGNLHSMFRHVFEPIMSRLDGVNHLIIVPSGPLQNMPLGILVASPAPKIETDADFRRVDWLAKRFAISVLPSASSMQAFRQFAQGSQAMEPFAGFGDPTIGELTTPVLGVKRKLQASSVFGSATSERAELVRSFAPGLDVANVDLIRRQVSLPETAGELRAMAKVLGANDRTIWLRERATEHSVKSLDLRRFRTIAFATHGVMSGQLKGVSEPGLILTPPKSGTVEDDGYLSSGEIAQLKLNADWVILSACNTAAADGTPDAEGLSGLAKAFFYAGARSLLVSHWSVETEATVALTTGMIETYQKYPELGKAAAHQKSILALMNTVGRPEFAHPRYWAPFVVVGEGGVTAH